MGLKKTAIKNEMIKVIKFLLTGGTAFIIQYSSLYLFKSILNLSNNISVSLSYFLSVLFHFLSNKFFVFRELSIDRMKIQVIKYVILAVVNYFITLLITNGLTLLHISVYISTPISVLFTTSLTFFVLNKIIFGKTENG